MKFANVSGNVTANRALSPRFNFNAANLRIDTAEKYTEAILCLKEYDRQKGYTLKNSCDDKSPVLGHINFNMDWKVRELSAEITLQDEQPIKFIYDQN